MITVGKHGANAHVSLLANALAGKPIGLHAQEFTNTTGTFRGERTRLGAYTLGRLPQEWRDVYKLNEPTFTVYSYGTPIAWLTRTGHWVVPDVSYSRTTKDHQSKIQGALNYNGTNYSTEIATPEKSAIAEHGLSKESSF